MYLINKNDPFIIALAETWLKPCSVFKIKNYFCLRDDRSDGYDGVALLIKSSHSFKPLHFPSRDDRFFIVGAMVNNICFISVYIPHPSAFILQELSIIISTLPQPFIILGDLNCQHQSWGSSTSSSYGKQLVDLIDNQNLCIINTGAPTRRTKPNEGFSAVDLSICTPCLASKLSWNILPYSHGSDHFPIVISYSNSNVISRDPPTRKPRLIYRLADADWFTFRAVVEINVLSLSQPAVHNENSCADELTNIITMAANKTFPIKNVFLDRISSPPWWDKDCTVAVQKRNQAEENYNLNMTSENFQTLEDVMANTKKILKQKKFSGWRNYCTTITPYTPPTIVWQNIRKFKSAVQDQTHFIPFQLSEQFLDYLAPPFVPQEELIISLPSSTDQTGLNCPFSYNELKHVLKHTNDSAPGEDGLPYSFYKNLGDSGLYYLLDLINTIMMSGNIPKSWKSQIIIPILKPNKPPNDVHSYRPIALSNAVSKIAELLVKNRLEWYLESNDLLASTQYGFRKGRSTVDSISIFVTDIRLALSHNESILATFLDIKSAYDNVILPILRQKLDQLHVPNMLSNFILNMLSGRFVKLESRTDDFRILWKGLPQGSVLSPLLYNIYTHDLELSLTHPVKVLQYADDLLIYLGTDRSLIMNACNEMTVSLHHLKS